MLSYLLIQRVRDVSSEDGCISILYPCMCIRISCFLLIMCWNVIDVFRFQFDTSAPFPSSTDDHSEVFSPCTRTMKTSSSTDQLQQHQKQPKVVTISCVAHRTSKGSSAKWNNSWKCNCLIWWERKRVLEVCYKGIMSCILADKGKTVETWKLKHGEILLL